MCIQNLTTLTLIEAKKFVTENLLGEKEKLTNKAMISSSRLILFYTIQQVIPNICTKFQNPRRSSSWEIVWHKFPYVLHWSERWKKKVKINHRILVFFLTLYLAPLKVYTKFEDSGCNTSWEFCDEMFIGEKDKWTNKGNDKQQHADSLLHNKSYPTFLPNFKILGAVVPEKSLTQMSLCITLEGWKKGKMEKDGKNKSQHHGFLSHNILGLATLKVYKKFEDSGSHRSWEICNRKFDWRERKMDK